MDVLRKSKQACALTLLVALTGCATPAERELDSLVEESARARLLGDRGPALHALNQALDRADKAPPTGARKTRLDAEVAAMAKLLQRTMLDGDPGALELEGRVQLAAAVLGHAGLSELRKLLGMELERRAQLGCAALTAQATPYARALARRYCRHFQLPVPPSLPLPHGHAGLEIVGRLRGVDRARSDAFAAQLEEAVFAASPWHSIEAQVTARAELSGNVDVGLTQGMATIDAPWEEQVPYQVSESYQQPYQDTETYTESVPYTTSESYSYSCGTGSSYQTCYGTRPRTEYRSDMRTRSVTRYRTATRMVTRYRAEPRVFRYQSLRIVGTYESDLKVMLRFSDGTPVLPVRVSHRDERQALSHDVTFAPAGVQPTRPSLTTIVGWFGEETAVLQRELVAALQKAWRDRFCALSRYSFEEAARCAHGVHPAPEAVTAALGKLLPAGDLRHLDALSAE